MGSITERGASSNSVNWIAGVFEISRTRPTDAVERHQCNLVFNSLLPMQPVLCITKDWSDVLNPTGTSDEPSSSMQYHLKASTMPAAAQSRTACSSQHGC